LGAALCVSEGGDTRQIQPRSEGVLMKRSCRTSAGAIVAYTEMKEADPPEIVT
jgi:hypothetical protein